jgi:hypothetical protein
VGSIGIAHRQRFVAPGFDLVIFDLNGFMALGGEAVLVIRWMTLILGIANSPFAVGGVAMIGPGGIASTFMVCRSL